MLLSLFISFFIGVFSVSAQEPSPQPEFNFQRAYKDLEFTEDQYRTKHTEYELARSQYLQSRTLNAQQKAQEATYNMLFTRDDVVKAHLTMLRMRLAESFGIPKDVVKVLQTRIDSEVVWYETHKTTLSSAESLTDQTADSNIAKNRYEKFTSPLIYEILTEIALGKQTFLRDQQKSIVNELETKISEIRAEGELPTDDIERGVLEVKNRIVRSESKDQEARKIITDAKKENLSTRFNQIVGRLGESVQYIKEGNTYMEQVLSFIKYGQ